MGVSDDLPAGDFSTWLDDIGGALRGEHGADVPCGSCTACCRSSQFVHVGPDETDTLAHIPGELLFPAPGLSPGHVLMGYDEHGCCPMLVDDRCSIYEHRPRTCRTYDCRVFPAAGIEPDADDQPLLAERTRGWAFTYRDDADRNLHDDVRAAAVHLREHRHDVPVNRTQLAVRAVEAVIVRRAREHGRATAGGDHDATGQRRGTDRRPVARRDDRGQPRPDDRRPR